MSGMDSWSVDFAKTAQAQQKLTEIAGKIRKESKAYQTSKQKMLDSWEGPHQQDFVEANASSVEESAEALAGKLEKLVEKVGELIADMKKRDARAADTLLGK